MTLLKMLLPLRLVGKHDYRAYATFTIMCAFFAVFAWEVFLTLDGGLPIDHYLPTYAFATCEVGQVPTVELLVDGLRALFMSTSFVELMVNILFLWIFGPLVEQFLGARRYISLFVITGFSGYIFSYWLGGSDCRVIFGPNSAIAGIISAFIFLYPTKRVETILRPILDRRIDFPAFFFGFVYMAIQFVAHGGGPLSGTFAPVWDEIGGFVVGFIFIFVTTLFKPAPPSDPFEYLDE